MSRLQEIWDEALEGNVSDKKTEALRVLKSMQTDTLQQGLALGALSKTQPAEDDGDLLDEILDAIKTSQDHAAALQHAISRLGGGA